MTPRSIGRSRSGSSRAQPGIISVLTPKSPTRAISGRPMSAIRRLSSVATRTGVVHAFVNRCAHRGALVRREVSGNATSHICIYHQWCYGLDGTLKSIPFRRGVRGKGGLDASFDMSAHGLQPLAVGNVSGVLFGTMAADAEPLEAYLGKPIIAQAAPPVRSKGQGARLHPPAHPRRTGSSMPRTPATITMPACCTNFS